MTPKDRHTIEWRDSGREPRCAPDPAFPAGKDVDYAGESALNACLVPLPYPAKRCGIYIVECKRCGLRAGVTTAGRADDPRLVRLPCKPLAN
jgi:hypothetical protein